jgi:hypothetical protein
LLSAREKGFLSGAAGQSRWRLIMKNLSIIIEEGGTDFPITERNRL